MTRPMCGVRVAFPGKESIELSVIDPELGRPELGWRLEATYAALPAVFHRPAGAARFAAPRAVVTNHPLGQELGLALEQLSDDEAGALFTGQRLPSGSVPLAQAYAGHQFGGFTMLGDGRAMLWGEQRTPDGRLFDLQFKGSGPTEYSRRGDGLAALGPMLREMIISHAMEQLGVPTTRSLAVAVTGQPVYRESRLPGAVLTRVAASHLRVGTFEYASAIRDESALRQLADYAIRRHDPDLIELGDRYLAWLDRVIDRQASLIAAWQAIGFVHGVMNTDNMAISGETIDYGPCAFLDVYEPRTVFSSIDSEGRYAYVNQPAIAQWNLARFAETLLPLIDPVEAKAIDAATARISDFPRRFDERFLERMRGKLGWQTASSGDRALVDDLLARMRRAEADFTETFDRLSTLDTRPAAEDPLTSIVGDWIAKWEERVAAEGSDPVAARSRMRRTNPCVIPRNHQVEAALTQATETGDLSAVEELMKGLTGPYDRRPDQDPYRRPPAPGGCRYRTFCGT